MARIVEWETVYDTKEYQSPLRNGHIASARHPLQASALLTFDPLSLELQAEGFVPRSTQVGIQPAHDPEVAQGYGRIVT